MRVMSSWYTPFIQDEIYGSLQARARPASLLKQLVHRHSLEGGVCKHNFILTPLLEDRHVLGNWYLLVRIRFGATAAFHLLDLCSAETPCMPERSCRRAFAWQQALQHHCLDHLVFWSPEWSCTAEDQRILLVLGSESV